jgi:hypothetical protein
LEIACLGGPVSNYVNHDVVFEVTSEGQPVEGSTVHFAGFERQTGEDGRVAFNIDMAGPFKARVEKLGYRDASTLLWVFPEGNEKFPIRAIRTLSGGQAGTTISDYRMAGANTASIKVYYLYDENGNIYPADPFPLGWRELPRGVHKKYQEWMISTVRDWGFENIYLIAQPLPESIFASEEPHPTVFTEEVKRNFLEQMREEALWLAEFAEEQNVDILDAFNLEATDIGNLGLSEDFLVYRNLLPELKEKFSGDLVVMMVGGIQHFVEGRELLEYDYNGFDYINPVLSCRHTDLNTGSPSEWEVAMHEYFDFTEQLGKKYEAKVMPVWLAGLHVHDEQLFNQFLRNGEFEDYEDVKVWFLNSILEEALKRNVDGVEACTLEYFSRLYGPHGPYGYKFPTWQSKRPLDTVAKYFSHPWNEEGRETLSFLQHAALLTNSIASYDQELAEWAEDNVVEALIAYRSGDYSTASLIAAEILKEASRVNNPLSIRIDGNPSEWQSLDPVYFNPSQILPWSSLSPWFNPETQPEGFFKAKDMRNLKSVYAVNDSDYLYLMLDFYGQPPQWIPYNRYKRRMESSRRKRIPYYYSASCALD